MGKKLSKREQREQLQAQRLQKGLAGQEKRDRIKREEEEKLLREKALKEAQREKEQRERMVAKLEEENPDTAKKKKSLPKAAGLKSAFILDENQILITSFGKGNKAVRERIYEGGDEVEVFESASLRMAKDDEKSFFVSGRIISEAHEDDPLWRTVKGTVQSENLGMDQIGCKSQLEKMYFGKTFLDNIHIQLIYKILDIEKIMSVHVSNIVFQLDNMLRREAAEHDDLIGYMGDRNSFEKFRTSEKTKELYDNFVELISKPQMAYFGPLFMGKDAKGRKLQGAAWESYEKRCYDLLVLIGTMRQATFHGEESYRKKLFDPLALKNNDTAFSTLDDLYKKRIDCLNQDFLKHSWKDLSFLLSLYGVTGNEEKEAFAQDYYRFLIKKEYKNLGFSVKRIRENLPDSDIRDEKYDTVRQKINRMLDFMISSYYRENASERIQLTEELRACIKDSEKEYLYVKAAKKVWGQIGENVSYRMLPGIIDFYKTKSDDTIDASYIENIKVVNEAEPFCEMVYLLTMFLDGKEINDLLTQLINIFENIASFIDVMELQGIDHEFKESYRIFDRSMQVSEELRIILSFARMAEMNPLAKKNMYVEAAELLGYEAEDVDDYVDSFVNKEKRKNTNFRNFIANNVIESSRFRYVVRYGNPKKMRALAQNERVVAFVIKGIPDTQICRYYNSVNVTNETYNDEMRADLVKKITGLNFTDFENVKQGKNLSSADRIDQERKKSLVRIYLTVLYLMMKNLVYVNSRYVLAFHSAERDDCIVNGRWEEPGKYFTPEEKTWYTFAEKFVNERSRNERARKYLNTNFSNADAWACRAFRNCVDHLNVIRNADKYINDVRKIDSYFELYHYLLQRNIMDQYSFESTRLSRNGGFIIDDERINPKLKTYFSLVEKYGTYCKDFVKALNVPFAYNLARYKNLSINELFDRNNYLPQKAKMNEE